MDTLQSVRAFLSAVRLGSFSAAAREQGTTPSVISKRVDQLEHRLGRRLLLRSTRQLSLTDDGAHTLPRCQALLAEFDSLVAPPGKRRELEGRLSVHIAGPAGAILLAPIIARFAAEHPQLSIDIRHTDALGNPLEARCDVSIGMRPQSYPGILDIPLMQYHRDACASPAYLAAMGRPTHPRELIGHHCLGQTSTGFEWRFAGPSGEVMIPIQPRVSANSSVYLRQAALAGLGIAILPHFIVKDDVKRGNLVEVFEEFAPVEQWLKALVPEARYDQPIIRLFLEFAIDQLRG